MREFEKLMDVFPGENFLSKTLIILPQFPNQKKNIILYQWAFWEYRQNPPVDCIDKE